MTEDPKVEIASDTGEKLQWGINLFFFKDGGKWTVKKRAALTFFGIVIAVVSILQCFTPDTVVVTVGESSITIPTSLNTTKRLSVAAAPKDTATSTKKGTSSSIKLSAP